MKGNNERKKLLLLGAMLSHVPVIKRAKERGLYVMTCDYIPENVGHSIADEPHYDSTTDMNAVCSLARNTHADGIMTFNSDPAAATAAYVAEALKLPSSGYDAVRIMSEKDRFRSFLRENGFNVPHFKSFSSQEELMSGIELIEYPVMVKPVDSSGSKGVVRVNSREELLLSFSESLTFSRCKRIIVEEYIEPKGAQIHGNAFVRDGIIEFIYLGDHHFDPEINNLLPMSTTWPSIRDDKEMKSVEDEVRRFITAVGYKQGGIDIEARISAKDGAIYLIEVGPRNGGDYVPIVLQYASGFNFIDAWLECAVGLASLPRKVCKKGFFCYMVIHAKQSGIMKSIYISDILQKHIIERHDYLSPGQYVERCTSSKYSVGILIVGFDTMEQMQDVVNNMDEHCQVIVE